MGRVTCDIISDQNIFQIERKIYDFFVSTYISKWVILVICQYHVSVAFYQNEILKNSSDDTYDNVNDDIGNWALEQGSLLFSKIEFSIKPDLKGLSFS